MKKTLMGIASVIVETFGGYVFTVIKTAGSVTDVISYMGTKRAYAAVTVGNHPRRDSPNVIIRHRNP